MYQQGGPGTTYTSHQDPINSSSHIASSQLGKCIAVQDIFSEVDDLQVFIGLFAGVQHRLSLDRGSNPRETVTQTLTTTEYHTLPYTETETFTKTRISTTTHIHSSTKGGKTETFTTTEKVTKTVKPVPVPGPTEGPEKVRDIFFKAFAYTCSNV